MSEQEYTWMLGLVAAWRQRIDDDQNKPPFQQMHELFGVAGRMQSYEHESANELTATLFILCLVLTWTYAKYRAKFVISRPEYCKLTGREFSQPDQLTAALSLDYTVAAWLALLVPFQSPPHSRINNQ